MNSSFEISKIDDINLKKYNLTLSKIKKDTKAIVEKLLNLKELESSKIFNKNINKIRFDISLCTNKTIHLINKQYRNIDKETDVITFSLFCDDDNNALIYRKCADLGQIIVSVEKADTQKKENNNTIEKEIAYLICHGILHLFGFDHLEKKDYDFVVGIQNKVLQSYE